MSSKISLKTKYLILIILFIITVFVWRFIFQNARDNILQVSFLNVGQGDAIFIEAPNGRQVLIDGGPDASVLEKLGELMPFYDRSIDLIILTHPHSDHLAGLLSVLEYFNIGHILINNTKEDTAIYNKWQELINQKNIPVTIAQTDQEVILQNIDKPNEISLKIFSNYSNDTNNSSIVTQLNYLESEFLLTGDIEKETENILLQNNFDLESDILKIAHHGSKSSSQKNFLEAINPDIVIISVGQNNRYNHPHKSVLERLKNLDIYRTDLDGTINILTDGFEFDIKTERYE